MPVGAAALIVPSPAAKAVSAPGVKAVSLAGGAGVSLQERVRSAGIFEVRVGIDSRGSSAGVVRLRFGDLDRDARVVPGHRVFVTVRLPIRGRLLTIRVFTKQVVATLNVTVKRVLRPARPHTRAATGSSGGSKAAAAPAAAGSSNSGLTAAAAGASTGATGAVGTASSQASSGTSGTAGSSGSAGASGSGGSGSGSGSGANSGGGSTGPGGAPTISLPSGFAPTATYTTLVKDYEFTGSSLPSDWTAGNDSTHGFNGTIFQASQVSMTGSSVALSVSNQPSQGYAYQSGWISTEGHYSLNYGLIDFRAKMPAGQGLWSGLWLDQPDNSNPWGEIDIQEMLLADTHTVYGSLHGWAPSQWGETQATRMAADASQGYHDYQLIWQPGLVTWAIDGVAYAQYTQAQALAAGYPWVQDDGTGYYLIADLAAGSNVWGGPPNSSTPFPSAMQIQSVKIWQ
jgi:hypothetical protein